MNGFEQLVGLSPVLVLIWIGVTYPVLADALKDTTVVPPVQCPLHHVVLGGVVDDADTSGTEDLIVHVGQFPTVR